MDGFISIQEHPNSRSVRKTEHARFSVAYDSELPTICIWKISDPEKFNIKTENSGKALVVSAVEKQPVRAEVYCILSNKCCKKETNKATLLMGYNTKFPIITCKPRNIKVDKGNNAFFLVDGDNVEKYEWFVYNDCPEDCKSTGVTTKCYEIKNVTENSSYYCILSNKNATVMTRVVTCTVIEGTPTVLEHPTSKTITVGKRVALGCKKNGIPNDNDVYRWFVNNIPIENTNDSVYKTKTYTDEEIEYYSCEINGVSSHHAVVTSQLLGQAPIVTIQPTNTNVSEGGTAIFTVTATGATPMTYTWYKDYNGSLTVVGATRTLSYYNVSPSDYLSTFYVVVSNSYGTATSQSVAIANSSEAPIILVQPRSLSVVNGQSAVFTVTSNNTTSYQWFNSDGAISGATANTYIINKVCTSMNNSMYWCQLTNPYGTTNSRVASLKVNRSWGLLALFLIILAVILITTIIMLAVLIPMFLLNNDQPVVVSQPHHRNHHHKHKNNATTTSNNGVAIPYSRQSSGVIPYPIQSSGVAPQFIPPPPPAQRFISPQQTLY
jgi:hypothetical protein